MTKTVILEALGWKTGIQAVPAIFQVIASEQSVKWQERIRN